MSNGDETTPEEQNESTHEGLSNWGKGLATVVAPIPVLGPATAGVILVADALDVGDRTSEAITGATIDEIAAEAAETVGEIREEIYTTEQEAIEVVKLQKTTRAMEQCYLTYHMRQLAEMHKATQEAQLPGEPPSPEFARFPRYPYKKTTMLHGTPGEIGPKLHLRRNAHKILDATTDQLANLVPMIKLYKIVDTETTSFEIPFKFYNHTVTATEARTDWAGYDGFDHNPPGLQARSGVGIKSFDWQYISGYPDTIKKDITAKLVLYFQSMDELIRIRHTSVYDPEQNEAILMEYSYLDLIVNPARVSEPAALSGDTSTASGPPCGVGSGEYDSSFYQIKASVGWAQWDGPSQELPMDFIDSIRYSKTDLFLTLSDHSFNINQDGSFELTVSYHSRLEGIMESPKSNILFSDKNIVNESPSFRQMINYEEELKRLKAENCVDNKQQIADAQKALINIQDGLKNETYKLIINNLLNPERFLGHSLSSADMLHTQAGTEVATTSSNPPLRLIYSMLVDPGHLAALASAKKLMPGSEINMENISASELVFAGFDPPSESSILENGKVVYDPANADEKIINFFFLGDLLDMLMITVFDNEKYDSLPEEIREMYSFNNTEVENLRLLLGPMEFRDPITGEVKSINIADIPVSIRAFTAWFHERVIKKKLVVYNFKTFVKDLIHGLIQTSLGKECFEDNDRHNGKVRNTYLSAPLLAVDSGEDSRERDQVYQRALKQNPIYEGDPLATPRVDMNDVRVHAPLFSGHGENYSVSENAHYIVIYTQGPGGLWYPGSPGHDIDGTRTARDVDLDRGIHHLFIGRDRGLLTNISFAKTDQPYLRQARLENAGAFNPIMQLSDVYEVTIEMMGNTLFYPGSRLYLNPFGLAWGEKFGAAHERGSLANIMGLGGYHIITRVDNYIESGQFKTTLQARFESAGDGCKVTNTSASDTNNCPEETAE